MASSPSRAVKCLNTLTDQRRFVFKTFSQRVEEIDIDVFHSLEPVRFEPKEGSSFLREALVYWRELNTAEDFISFYEEMMPLVQTLPQILLHKEKIFSELLGRLHMGAKLSIEPILMLVVAFSRDILKDFLPFLQRLARSITCLLLAGGDRDPEILEQVFKAWSYIIMYLQKNLKKDVVTLLKITVQLWCYPKDYVQEFVAEAVSFLLRNASLNQLKAGIRRILVVAKISSSHRKTGATSLIWHTMRGTSSRLHSRAKTVFLLLLKETALNIRDVPQELEAVLEVVTGILQRLCEEIDHKEQNVVYECLFECIHGRIAQGCLAQVDQLLTLLITAIRLSKSGEVFDSIKMSELVRLLIQAYIPLADRKSEGCPSEVAFPAVCNKILHLLLCLLDFPQNCSYIDIIVEFAPLLKLEESCLLMFVKGLILKDPGVVLLCGTYIFSAFDEMIEVSPDEVLFLMLTFFKRQSYNIANEIPAKICKFLTDTIHYWCELLNSIATIRIHTDLLSRLTILWGVISCYPYFPHTMENVMQVKNLIDKLDQLLKCEVGVPVSIWQDLLGVTLDSYQKLLLREFSQPADAHFFLNLAKRYKSSPCILSAVAEYFDSSLGSNHEAGVFQGIFSEIGVEDACISINLFADNLSLPNKEIRIVTLRLLSHYALLDEYPTSEDRPNKKVKYEESVSVRVSRCINVVDVLLSIERTPISVSTSRKIFILISKLQTALSSGMVNEGYAPLLLNGFIGILHNRFSLLWDHVLECLTILIRRFQKNTWDLFFQHLEFYQVKSLSLDVGASKLKSEFHQAKTLAECFNQCIAHEFDSTPCTTVLTLLLQVLQKAPNIAELCSHQLIPLFLNFLGYTGVDSVEFFIEQKCKGKEWRSILKEWLNLVKLMDNCRSLYKNQVLKDVLVNRLLDDVDPDIQLKSIECLLNWKDDYLIPYHQHLRNIIVPKNLREELITWDISQNSGHVEEAHRAQLIPIVVRLLLPKVRKLKTFAPRKHAGVHNRRAILSFLSQLEVGELHLFFLLLLKSLFGGDHGTVSLEGHSDSAFVVQPQTFSLLNGSIFKAIENLTLKKKYGFLYLVEDIFKTFDAFHIQPFLSSLMKLVSLILKSCMSTKKNEDGNQFHSSDCGLSGDFGVDDAAISAQSSAVMCKPTKQFKDLRSLCLKIISLALNKHDSLDFGDEFWDIFFQSVKPLIDSFKHEGSSSEKPSSLFSCFLALSRSPALVSYLNREENLVPSIFSILTVRTASDAIISSVLNFIENLLKLDNDFDQENDSVKEVFHPHLEVLIHSFHELFQSRRHAPRKFATWPGKSELRIFKMMVKYITNPLLAAQFLDIFLPFFKRKMLDFDDCLEALNILKGILQHLTSEGYKISGKILKAIHPILAVAGSDVRLCICDIINCLAGCDPSLTYLDGLLQKLNAVSSVDIGEIDYDTRVIAYETISPELFSSHVADHTLVILSHCVYDMSSDELILRQCASKSLLAFIHFASSHLKKDTEDSLADGAECKEAPTAAAGVETGHLNWTKAGIQWVIKSIFLKNMRESMTKDISIQKEWVTLLRDMVYNLHEIPDLNSFRPLCSQDAEVDFFNNILHLQVHRKRRALLRFKNAISAGNFAENIVVNIFVPLFFNMMINVKDGKGGRIRDACLDSLASIAMHMQWKSYCSFLMRCFREITVHPDKQKILVRLVCAVLDNFHFYASSSADMDKDPRVTSGVVVQGHSVRHVPLDIEIYLQKVVLPRIQKLLIIDSEKVNVNASLAGLKLLKLLPADIMDSQLSSIIHHICNFLKNRLESLRDEARSALAVCANELGIEYLPFIIKILRAALKRGYEMHVLGYTLNLILSKTLSRNTTGSLDYCLEELLSIVENDILGDVAEEKEVEKIASKMKETRRNKSFETLKLISQSITFRTHALRLLSPIYKHMEQHLTPKTKRKLETMLHNIASGIECNPSVQTAELFIVVYGLIEDSIASEFSHCRGRLEALTNEKSLHDAKVKEKTSCINAIGMKNSHLISVFALGVLHNRLKNMKIDKNDQQLLSMLDPFVKQLGDCLNSKYEDVLSAAFRCLAPLIKLPLPSFDMYANKIKTLLLCIAERSGSGNGPMVQSCLKLLMVLLRCSRISISDDELHMIIQFPMFIDIQSTPSPLALSLLKSIVAQKLVVPEIYDIVLRVAELMVTTLSEPIRKKCSQILLQFLLDYQLSEKRLQQHLDFLLSNLSYEHSLGRESVLEMLHAIIIKLPDRVIDNNVQTFFLHLVVALANEHNQKVRSMVSTVLKVLIDKTSDLMLDPILEYSLSWYFGEKQNLWSAAAQVIGLLIEVLKGGIEKDISAIVQTATKILKVSVDALHDLELGFSSELVGVPLWKEAYDSLFMLEKMLLRFPDLHFQLAFQEIWGAICKFLLHPHVWLRNISSRLVALYFAAVSERSRADSEKFNQTTLYLINPSRLFSIAVSFLTQLETQEMDDASGKIIAQNIVFSICGLHSFAKQKYHTSFRKMWSMFDVSEQNSYLEAFDLLGSREAKRTFLLSTSVTSQFPTKEEDTSALDNFENLQSLLVVPLLRKLGKIAMGRDDSQMKIIFNCLRKISSQIGTQGISDYSVYVLLPLYKVCEGYAGKIISDDAKQFAEEVRNGIRDLLGVDHFVQICNQIRKELKRKRDKRRQHQKLIAVINPMLHAKRKLRVAAKHRANKRRKVETIKMGKRT